MITWVCVNRVVHLSGKKKRKRMGLLIVNVFTNGRNGKLPFLLISKKKKKKKKKKKRRRNS